MSADERPASRPALISAFVAELQASDDLPSSFAGFIRGHADAIDADFCREVIVALAAEIAAQKATDDQDEMAGLFPLFGLALMFRDGLKEVRRGGL